MSIEEANMQGQCVVAVYNSRNDAEEAYRAVVGSGVPADHVRLSNQPSQSSSERASESSDGGSFWDWLFGSDVPADERRLYESHMERGGTALSVLVDAPTMADLERIEGVLQEYNPVEIHEENGGGSTAVGSGVSGPSVRQEGYDSQGDEPEKVIPLPEEELKVGKRATETVKHIRTYVVEEPVQKDVQLRDERTVIERRPATGAATGQPTEREYEVRELHEEPVVQKETRAGEELVVRKEAAERTERVADTVKKTRADIDKTER
ncbi:YsnF/AvaK domain-containing protein [Bradyrhizobium sp. BRP20]|uniref:YsnF/AvaK domain-containing protein n=2 Tax=Bradyrhizobium TaxID=374 RepID=UPI001CD722F8|nr:YsnF/AvaK domain-containing protein [Bradyrhizobium sp. BRP20]MCA1437013.1 YsnF/AvaK domain-containing protein [Bradyrhizobium sp. BRP20]